MARTEIHNVRQVLQILGFYHIHSSKPFSRECARFLGLQGRLDARTEESQKSPSMCRRRSCEVISPSLLLHGKGSIMLVRNAHLPQKMKCTHEFRETLPRPQSPNENLRTLADFRIVCKLFLGKTSKSASTVQENMKNASVSSHSKHHKRPRRGSRAAFTMQKLYSFYI